MKNTAKANLLKNRGNEDFSKNEFQEALLNYNKALCFADSNELKSILYGNRSAVYFEVKRYNLCLENIQLAESLDYPVDKIEKLKVREFKCHQRIKSGDEKKDTIVSDFFKLSHDSHKTIPFIVDAIDVKSSKKYGKYLVTNKDFKAGDIIAIEEPYGKQLRFESCYKRCGNCMRASYYSLIPCETCCEGEFLNKSRNINFQLFSI